MGIDTVKEALYSLVNSSFQPHSSIVSDYEPLFISGLESTSLDLKLGKEDLFIARSQPQNHLILKDSETLRGTEGRSPRRRLEGSWCPTTVPRYELL